MKATFSLANAIDKVLNILVFIPVVVWVMYPSIARADNYSSHYLRETAQIFEVKVAQNEVTTELPQNQTTENKTLRTPDQIIADMGIDVNSEVEHQTKLAYKNKLYIYLTQLGSPFAQCSDLLVELKNTDKILSLAAAESSMGKRAPAGKHNYWGVGGSNLWKMGNNVCEGIQSMDNFLEAYPRRSSVKYADMTIDRMNGLYKQPRAAHWANNNNAILNKLSGLKAQSKAEAEQIVNTKIDFYVNLENASSISELSL